MISYIVFLLLGFAVLEVNCGKAEFVTNLFRNGIRFKIPKKQDTIFYILKSDVSFVLNYSKENGIECNVKAMKGLPFVLARYKRRAGIYIGIILFIMTVFTSGRVVWKIDVTGNEKIPASEIAENLERLGFTYGTNFKRIDFDDLRRDYLIENDDLSWISVNMKGTYAHVEVRELKKTAGGNGPGLCNIVASENGKILLVEAEEGKTCVYPGDKVSKGDLLIGCVMTSGEDRLRFERAQGTVLAEVKRKFTYTIPYEKAVYSPSGAESIEKTLIFFKKDIKFSKSSGNSFRFYDTIDGVNYIYLKEGLFVPFGFRSVTYRELQKDTVIMNENEAEVEAEKLFGNYLNDCLCGAKLLSYERRDFTAEKGHTVECDVLCLADIAMGVEVPSDLDS